MVWDSKLLLPLGFAGSRGASQQWWGSASPSLEDPRGKASPERGDSHGRSRNFPTVKHTNRAAQGSEKDPCPPRRLREEGKEEEYLTVTITQPTEVYPMPYLFQRGP